MAAMARDRGGPKVDTLYGLMQSYENKLGGGEGIEGLYGSLTQASMQKVLDCLKHNSGLDSRSVFVDIGAGLGRPLLHAMVSIGISSAWGVELDRVKCDKAAAFCENVTQHLITQGVLASTVAVPAVLCSSIEKVTSLDPATHAYSFWEGVPPSGKEAFGELFALSRTLRAVAVVQRAIRGEEPAAMMRDYGFGPVLLIANFPVKMSGSGRSFTAYVFTKIAPAAANFLASVTAGAATPPTPPPALARGSSAALALAKHQAHRAIKTPTPQPPAQQRDQTLRRAAAARAAGSSDATQNVGNYQPGQLIEKVQPSKEPVSPSKARKPEDEAAPASPAKKACAGSSGAASAAVSEGSERVAERPSAADGRAKAVQQVLLTSLPEYSRRTKQAVAGSGKTASGKGGPNKAAPATSGKDAGSSRGGYKAPPAVATRSSRRLAAKVAAGKAAVAAVPNVAVEGEPPESPHFCRPRVTAI